MACKKHGCEQQGCETRREALLDAAVLTTAAEQGASVVGKLLEIISAGGGLMYIFKDNPKLTELAESIKILAAENQYLKKKLSAVSAPIIDNDTADLVFKFGPKNAFTLMVPIGSLENRGNLAGQLIRTAADLMGKPDTITTAEAMKYFPNQKVFPFAENPAKLEN